MTKQFLLKQCLKSEKTNLEPFEIERIDKMTSLLLLDGREASVNGTDCPREPPGRTHIAAKTPEKEAETRDYVAKMHAAVAKYGRDLVIGADETPLRSIASSRKTIAHVGTESVRIRKVGNEKEQLTAMLAVTVGGAKLKPMIIAKGTTQLCLRRFNLNDREIIGAFSSNGWMNSKLMVKFLEDSILQYTQGRPCALSLDDFRAHWSEEVTEFAAANNIELVHISAGITGEYQSLDVRVNGILKSIQNGMQRLERVENSDRKFNLEDAVRYFRSGWAQIDKEVIISSWAPMNFPESQV